MRIFVAGLVLYTAVLAQSVKIPEFVQLCKRSDPNHRECLKSSLQNLLPSLVEGIPEFEVQPVDPFYLPELMVQYQRGPINVKCVNRNSNTYGMANMQVKDVRFELDEQENMHLEVDVKFPRIYIEGDYKVDGHVAVFPVYGKGRFNNSMSDVSATWKIDGKPVTKNGQVYMKIEHFNMRPQVGDMKIHATNLFGGDKVLSESTLAFANEFWPLIYQELVPYVSEIWDEVMTSIANKIFLRVPFKQLFPEA